MSLGRQSQASCYLQPSLLSASKTEGSHSFDAQTRTPHQSPLVTMRKKGANVHRASGELRPPGTEHSPSQLAIAMGNLSV